MPQTGDMHVQLKLVLECPPDAAWRAVRSPSVFAQVSSPLLAFEPLAVDGSRGAAFPEEWDEGSHPVRARALWGLLDAGTQDIDVTFRTLHRGTAREVRIFEDHGGPLSGPLCARDRLASPHGDLAGTERRHDPVP